MPAAGATEAEPAQRGGRSGAVQHAFDEHTGQQLVAAGADLIAPGGRIPIAGGAHDGTTGRIRLRYKPATVGPTDSGFPSRQNRPSPVD